MQQLDIEGVAGVGHNSNDVDAERERLYKAFSAAHEEALGLGRRSVEKGVEAGEALLRARRTFKGDQFGEWTRWLESKRLAESTVYKYLILGEFFGKLAKTPRRGAFTGLNEAFDACCDERDRRDAVQAEKERRELLAKKAELEAQARDDEARAAQARGAGNEKSAEEYAARALKGQKAAGKAARGAVEAEKRAAKAVEAPKRRAAAREVAQSAEPSAAYVAKEKAAPTNEWYTPVEVIELAKRVLGEIDLDPASCEEANETVGASRFFDEDEDGLDREWDADRVWCNPPYLAPAGENAADWLKRWVSKMDGEICAGRAKEGIMLLNAETHSGYAQVGFRAAQAVCLWEGRMSFRGPNDPEGKGVSPKGQMLLYFGTRPERFSEVFSPYGAVFSTQEETR